MIEAKKIFITGGAGFIGGRIAMEYITNNDIVIFDNFARNSLSKLQSKSDKNLKIVKGDVLDLDQLSKAMLGADIVVHAAGVAGIDNVMKSPIRTMEVNMMGTANVLRAASELASVDKVIDFSTSEVFGSRAYLASESEATLTGAVGEARWIYAVSKLASEHLASAYFKEKRLPVTILRPFNIYGPGQVGEGAIAVMIRRALNNEDIYIFGDGTQIRAWCYIDDMIDAIDRILLNEKSTGESLNIGNARAVTTIYGLAETICRVLSSKSRIIFKPALSADIELRIPSTKKAEELVGFKAKVELNEGIRRTAEWISANEDALPKLPDMFLK